MAQYTITVTIDDIEGPNGEELGIELDVNPKPAEDTPVTPALEAAQVLATTLAHAMFPGKFKQEAQQVGEGD